MTTAVVQCHPVPDSLNAELLARVESGLVHAGVRPAVYRLSLGERPEPDDLAQCQTLVLVYPTWWGGQPAQLLDWLQDMLDADALGSVKRLAAVTTHGSSKLINRLQGEWGRRNLSDRVIAACAPDAAFAWLPLYKVDRQPQKTIDLHLTTVAARFASRG